jgi:hypothetical protein
VLPPEQPPASPGEPTQPIYLPPGVWPNPPAGGQPPQMPVVPTHPIVIPPPTDGGEQPPEGGGVPTHPIAGIPGIPVHPIYPPEGFVIIWVPGYGYALAPIGGVSQPPQVEHHRR